MIKADLPELMAEIIAAKAIAGARMEVNERFVDVWFRVLRSYDLKAVKEAVSRWFESHERMPTPSQVRSLLQESGAAANSHQSLAPCSYEFQGQRCPLAAGVQRSGGPWLCYDHDTLRGKPEEGADFLRMAIERQIPWKPASNDLAIARNMPDLETVRRCYGEPMARYLSANPL